MLIEQRPLYLATATRVWSKRPGYAVNYTKKNK